MHNLLPHFILEKYSQGEQSGRFPATALFVDISGFSTITDTLMQHGQHGAEVLATILRDIFDPLVAHVFGCGGFIVGFAGDAFTAVFPHTTNASTSFAALAAAWQTQQHMGAHAQHATPYGTFTVSAKAGAAAGEVGWGIVTSADNRRASFYFEGTAIDGCADAEKLASAGDVIMNAACYAEVSDRVTAVPITGHFCLTQFNADLPAIRPIHMPAMDPEAMTRFFPQALVTQAIRSEFRQVVVLFISLPTIRTETQIRAFMQSLFALQERYGGLLNRLDFGDKGAHLILFWGAPITYENDVQRALNLILDLQAQTAMPINAGITYQISHAGFVGSALHEEYTCYGRGVNLAARFMTSAPSGEIWVDEHIAQRASDYFEMEADGAHAFKGFAEKQQVFILIERKEAGAAFYQGQWIGRQAELAQLADFVQPIFHGQYAGALVIWGEPGIGKSRLVHEFQTSNLIAEAGVVWALCPADEILREPLNPFRYWLKQQFGVSDTQVESRNKRSFNRRLQSVIDATKDMALANELDRTRSFLGALLNLHWPDSLYAQLDAQGRYENTAIALITLLKTVSRQQPLVLFIDDAHWLDDGSKAFLPQLARALTAVTDDPYPIAILATARFEGTALPLGETLAGQEIHLGGMTPDEMTRLAHTVLDSPAAPALCALLAQRAAGNPFFAEQTLRFMREEDLLVQSKEGWQPRAAARQGALPTDVRAMLVARLDRLARHIQELVQTAAVLGREFELRLLARMLHDAVSVENDVPSLVLQAEQDAIWSALSEYRYVFKHALLRETAYRMQLRARRKALHRLAAEALEQLTAAESTPPYGELAYHAERGDLPQQARRYLELAGDEASSVYQNSAAIAYYGRALALTPAEELQARYDLHLKREAVYHLQGERVEQAAELDSLVQLAAALADERRLAEAYLRRAKCAEATGEYETAVSAAQTAMRHAEAALATDLVAQGHLEWGVACKNQGELAAAQMQLTQALALTTGQSQTAAAALRGLGNVANSQGEYAEASNYYEQALAICRQIGDRVGEKTTIRNLGVVATSLGEVARANQYYEQALAISRQTGDRRGEGITLMSLGIAAEDQGDYARANERYEHALSISRQIGDRMLEGATATNLGSVAWRQGKYVRAGAYFEQSLVISRQIGDRWGEGIALFNLGSVDLSQGRYDQAQEYYEQSLAISCQIGDQWGEGETNNNLGIVAQSQGEYAAANDYYEQGLTIRRQIGDRRGVGMTLNNLGHLCLEQALPIQAYTHYEAALTIMRQLDLPRYIMESLAGLAMVALHQNKLGKAQDYVEEILGRLHTHTLDGAEDPFRVYLSCYRVLQAANDARAAGMLATAYDEIQARAAGIPDEETRQAFLQAVRIHCEIVNAYKQLIDRQK